MTILDQMKRNPGHYADEDIKQELSLSDNTFDRYLAGMLDRAYEEGVHNPEAVDRAYDDGREAGLEQGLSEGRAEADEVVERLEAQVEQLEGEVEELEQELLARGEQDD